MGSPCTQSQDHPKVYGGSDCQCRCWLRLRSLTGKVFPQVQESVASCLPPLVPAIKEDAGAMIQRLMQQLLESDKYAERKGAAYGLAGLVKGLGILSLKQQEMMAALTDAIQDKKNFRRREGEYSHTWDCPGAGPMTCLRVFEGPHFY